MNPYLLYALVALLPTAAFGALIWGLRAARRLSAARARLADIYRAEAALRQRGLDVRETAVR